MICPLGVMMVVVGCGMVGSLPGLLRRRPAGTGSGADVDPDLSLVTVGQWLDIWLEARQTLRPATRLGCVAVR